MSITEKYKKEVEWQKQDAEMIRTATDYTNSYIKHGGACDSSDRANRRIKYVKQAEKEFIEKNKIEILNRASEICLDDI